MNKLVSLLWILLSTCLISGSATATYLYVRHWRAQAVNNDAYLIRHIVQTGPKKEQLKTAYLAELLDLSVDQPTNLYALDLREAASKLLKSPVVERIELSRKRPSTLVIDYTVRRPIGQLALHSNTGIDAKGQLFPLHPFFTPKKLPEVILGTSQKSVEIALELLQAQGVLRVDTSQVDHESVGRQQIVLVLDACTLRLNPNTYKEGLENYFRLREHLEAMPEVIDLRLQNLAYLQ